jgi:hypothetical protein
MKQNLFQQWLAETGLSYWQASHALGIGYSKVGAMATGAITSNGTVTAPTLLDKYAMTAVLHKLEPVSKDKKERRTGLAIAAAKAQLGPYPESRPR